MKKQDLTTQDLKDLGWEYFTDVTQNMKIWEFSVLHHYYYLFFDSTNPSMVSIHMAGSKTKDKLEVFKSPQIFRGRLIANYPCTELEVIMQQVMF